MAYLDLTGLQRYDEKIKALLDEGVPVTTGKDIGDDTNLFGSKAQHFEAQVTYNGIAYDGTVVTQQSSSKEFATQLFIGWVGIVLRRTRQSGNWNSWEKIPAGKADNGILERPNQYYRITDLDTGIYRLTYNGTKYLYYYGKTNTTLKHTVGTGSAPCLLYVQKYGTTWWEWHYFYATATTLKYLVSGVSTETSPYGSVSTLILPNGMGASGKILKSNGSSSAPTWGDVTASLPFDTWDGYGNSGSLVLPSGGWYYITQVPGSGIMFQAESSYSTKAQIFEIDTATDTITTIETTYANSKITLVSKTKTGAGSWTEATKYFYYKKLG